MFKVDTASLLESVCRLHAAGRISTKVFHASVCEAAKSGVDWRTVLSAAGVNPNSLPRYASLVSN